MTEGLNNFIGYGLALCRVGGAVAVAPAFGNHVLPRRVKLLIALTLTLGLLPVLPTALDLPTDLPRLTLAVAGELAFGVLLGLAAALVFTAVGCAGEMISHQLGLSLAQILDPTTGEETPLLANFYLTFATIIFLLINGHHAVIRVLAATFHAVPLASATFARPNLDLLTGLLHSATFLTIQLAAPVVLTMILVDLTLGMATRLVPQLNVMSLAVSVRSIIGIVLLLLGAVVIAKALGSAMTTWMTRLSPTLTGGA